jgi:hypothetical protein
MTCELLKVVQDGLKGGRIDIELADNVISKGNSVAQDFCNYCLASFLQLHGQTDSAKTRMIKAATSPTVGGTRNRAMIWLRERKIPFGKPRPIDPPKEADAQATSKP